MKLTITSCVTTTRAAFIAPTLGAAGEQSAFFRVDGHAQVLSPIAAPLKSAAGMVTGHRPWSPPIT